MAVRGHHLGMATTTTKQIELHDLTAECLTDGWTVIDPAGGRWWPSEEAAEAITAAADPAAEAVRIASQEPMRGTWHC